MTPRSPGLPAEPPAGSAPHLLVDDLRSLEPGEASWHHLLRVRRARVGSKVTVTDGAGRWLPCRIASPTELEPAGDVVAVPRREPEITVAFALTKADKPDLAVQKLTELGVDRIAPFRAARSVVRWDERRSEAAVRRWNAVVRSAVEQSKRCRVPEIAPVVDVETLAGWGAARVDRGGAPPSLSHSVLAVGPEGGWDEAERAMLPAAVGLGPHVLRAETAALTAGAVLCSLRSGLVVEATGNGADG